MIREKQPVWRLGELPPRRSSRHGKTTVKIGPCSTPRVQSPASIARHRRTSTPAALTHWGSVTPFVLKSSAQFRPAEPPAVNSPRALADIEEVKAIGGSKSVTRTAEQSEIARYWYENSPRGWNRIAREVLAARQFDVWENARLFALVNLAMADGYIAEFRIQIPLQLLAADHCHSRKWRQRMAELPSDPAGTGLPIGSHGGRGCCGYGDGPVLQHRLHQFFDDERRTLPWHHPQVLELLGSSARKWCVPYP